MSDDAERLVVLLEARIRDFEKNMQKAAGTADTAYSRMRRGSRTATDQMADDMQRNTSRINQALAQTSTKIGAFAKAFAAGLVAGGVAEFVGQIRRVITELADLKDAAERVGLTTKAFQELSFGFKLAGVEADAFTTNMEQFTKRIGEAATKGGQLAKIFDANKVALRDSNGVIRSSESLLRDYANLVSRAASEQEQMTLATEAFGRGGGDMVLALKEGAAGIDAMAEAAANAGGVIDDELIKKAAEIDDRFDIMWRRFEISAKSATLAAVAGIDAVIARIVSLDEHYRQMKAAGDLGATLGGMVGRPGDARTTPTDPRDPLANRFGGASGFGTDDDVARLLRERYGPRTVIPSGDEEKKRATRVAGIKQETEALKEARKAHDLYLDTLRLERDLQFERQQMMRDPIEQRVYQELYDLGIDINSVRGQQLATEIRLTEKAYAQRDALEEVGGILADMFSAPLAAGETFFDRMLQQAGQLGNAIAKSGVFGKASGVVGAGIGGLGAGFGAADPLQGALGGALGGFMAGGGFTPMGAIGAAVGGIAGLIGGIFGQAKKRREEAAALAKALEDVGLRVMRATADMETLEGQLAVFERSAALEISRLHEARASAELILETERALAAERVQVIKAHRDSALDELRAAYERESGALRDVMGRHNAYIDTLLRFRDALALDNLSMLDPGERLREAERQARETAAAAAGGDEGAQGRVTEALRIWREEARSYFGPTGQFAGVVDEINRIVDGQVWNARAQMGAAEQQLAALNAQVGWLVSIDAGIKSVAVAFAGWQAAEAAYQQAMAAQTAIPAAPTPPPAAAPDAGPSWGGGGDYYGGADGGGSTGGWGFSGVGYSSGGYTGERGGIVHPREFVLRADATRAIGRTALETMNRTGQMPTNDNRIGAGDKAIVAAIGALSAEVAGLRTEQRRLAAEQSKRR